MRFAAGSEISEIKTVIYAAIRLHPGEIIVIIMRHIIFGGGG